MLHANLRSILCISSAGSAHVSSLHLRSAGCPRPPVRAAASGQWLVSRRTNVAQQDLLNLMGGRLKDTDTHQKLKEAFQASLLPLRGRFYESKSYTAKDNGGTP